MAIPHCRVTAQSRAQGESAVAKAAYDSASLLKDSGQAFDYRKKRGVIHQQLIFSDGEEPQSRGAFWRAVEKAEKRCDACVSREIVIALPLELDQTARIKLAKEVSETILKRYKFKAVDLCIHEPQPDRRKKTATSQENPHAHIHIPTRDKDGNKLRQFNGPGGCNTREIKAIRKIFEEITNKHLKQAGLAVRISVDTLEKQLADTESAITKASETIKALQEKQPPSPLYICHYEDLLKICKNGTEEDINFRLACRLRATGHSQEETAKIIDSFQHNPTYSQRAAQAAFTSPKADKDLKKLAKWIPGWKRLELSSMLPEWKIKERIERCQIASRNSMNSAQHAMNQ